ncbi:MAG: DNA starvation/stationary phase protection protein [Verrucomicrobiota bacterium]
MKTTAKKTADTTEKELAHLLADTYALLGQTQFAHWNVQGPAFFSLHTFLQTQYEELFLAVDEIAERLRALDVISPGGLKTLASLSSITEFAVKAHPAKDLVAHLLGAHEILVDTAKKLRDLAEKSGDAETQDLAIKRIQIHEKTIWMLRAFLKNV